MSRRSFLATAAAAGAMLPVLVKPAAAGRLGDPASRTAEHVRVLLRRPGGAPDAPMAHLSGEGSFVVRDLASGAVVAAIDANAPVAFGREGGELWLRVGDGVRQGPLEGPLQLVADNSGARLVDRSAGDRPATYRGVLEVARAPVADRVAIVNVLGAEDYLAGVVPREMPASFGAEPARAQAVAARGFLLASIARGTHKASQADVCDATDCQVYGGASAEHSLHSEAVEATRGQVLLAGGRPIEPVYSSTCGGHTEALALLFGGSPPAGSQGGAVADGELPSGIDLTSDEGAAVFYRNGWDSHCAAATRYRWRVSWEPRQLEEMLTAGLRRLSAGPGLDPPFGPEAALGTLVDLTVTRRGMSGRALELQVQGSRGSWTVRRDWNVRQLLRTPAGEPLSSSAFVLEIERGADGQVRRVTALGAGWGHGAGMCQWGARGLAARGLGYQAILAHYYPGAELGAMR